MDQLLDGLGQVSKRITYYPPGRVLLDQRNVVVGTSSTQLVGPNDKRWAIVISAPNANFTDQLNNTQVGNFPTVAVGIKESFTVPAGGQGTLLTATRFDTGAAGAVIALQIVRGGSTITLQQTSGNTQANLNLPLLSGDVVQWNVTTGIAASASDLTLGIIQTQGFGRMTLSFNRAAVIDQGINRYPGQTELMLMYEALGDAIRGEITAISANGSPTIGVLDLLVP